MPSRDPHRDAIVEALKVGSELDRIFARIGTSTHSRGRILVVYRNALRALEKELAADEPNMLAVGEILGGLRREVESFAREVMSASADLGLQSIKNQIDIYGIDPGVDPEMLGWQLLAMQEEAVAAVTSQVERQSTSALAMLMSGADRAMILGDTDRQGIIRPSPVTQDMAYWAAAGFAGAYALFTKANGKIPFKKQAVAACDDHTTETCLRVHGQIQPLDEPFKLIGTPRYADELDWSPFHWWCRTSCALYMDEYDIGMTEMMRAQAANELDRRWRETGSYGPTAKRPIVTRPKPKPPTEVTPVILPPEEIPPEEKIEIEGQMAPRDVPLSDAQKAAWEAGEHFTRGLPGSPTRLEDLTESMVKGLPAPRGMGFEDETLQAAKHDLIVELSERTGIGYEQMDAFVRGWAQTSNDDSLAMLTTQEIAADLFGGKLSPWQEERLASLRERFPDAVTSSFALWPGEPLQLVPYATPEEAVRATLRAMYDVTQERFAADGITELVIRRGFSTSDESLIDFFSDISSGDRVDIQSNALESWSFSGFIAEYFASERPGGGIGMVFETRVPVERIFSTPRSGFGCLDEWEVVVIGGDFGDSATLRRPEEERAEW